MSPTPLILKFPKDKRAHRFFPLEKEDMIYPGGRTDAYTIIEITMIEGRTTETKEKGTEGLNINQLHSMCYYRYPA